jgi:putative transposase
VSCFRFVESQCTTYPVKRLCELVAVPRSSYNLWASGSVSDRYVDDAWLANDIHDIHVASRHTYGAPRIAGQLRNRGERLGTKRVARIMASCGIVGAHSRRKWRQGRANTAFAPDRIGRDFTAERSNQRWVADITEFKCTDGRLYLAGIKDLHDQGFAGWSMGDRRPTDLVVNALVMALARRMPDGELIHHADRGSQGGFNRSSQHLDVEVSDGQAGGVDEGVDGAFADEVSGCAVASSRDRARVLEAGCDGDHERGGRGVCWCVSGGRGPVVPPWWWDGSNGSDRGDWPVLVVR